MGQGYPSYSMEWDAPLSHPILATIPVMHPDRYPPSLSTSSFHSFILFLFLSLSFLFSFLPFFFFSLSFSLSFFFFFFPFSFFFSSSFLPFSSSLPAWMGLRIPTSSRSHFLTGMVRDCRDTSHPVGT